MSVLKNESDNIPLSSTIEILVLSLYNFIGHSQFLERGQRFGLVTPDSFLHRKIGSRHLTKE